jgi:hypothetical protein
MLREDRREHAWDNVNDSGQARPALLWP